MKALGARHNGGGVTAWTTSGKWRPIAPSAAGPRPPQSPTLPILKRGYLATISARGAEGFDYCPCGAPTLPRVGLEVLPIVRRIFRPTRTASAMPAAFILPRVAVPYASCCRDVVAKAAGSRASKRDRSALIDYPADRPCGGRRLDRAPGPRAAGMRL
jgi:hypothetical protein